MRFVGHLVNFDIRRNRWVMLGWIFITLGTVAAQALAPFLGDRRDTLAFETAVSLGWVAQILLGGLLIPLIVQTHTTIGTTAFWMTRPLPPGALAGSKLLLLGVLFVAVPALLDACVLTVYSVPPGPLALAVLEAALVRTAILAAVLCFAVLTRNLARFAIAIGAIAIGFVVLVNLWVVASMMRAEDSFVSATLAVGDTSWLSAPFMRDPTPGVLAMVGIIALGVFVVVRQYRTRETFRSVVVTTVGLVVLGIVAQAWPWPLLAKRETLAEAGPVAGARLIAADGAVAVVRGPELDTPSRWRIARGTAYLEGIPPGWLATTYLRSATITTADGMTIQSASSGYPVMLKPSAASPTFSHLGLQKVLGADAVVASGVDSGDPLVMFSAYDMPVFEGEFAGAYRGEFVIRLEEMSIAGVLPLDRSSTMQSGAFKATLLEALWFDGGVRVRFRVSNVIPSHFRAAPAESYDFYLRSASRRRAVEGQHLHSSQLFTMGPSLGNTGVYLASALPFTADSREMVFSSTLYGRQFAVNVDRSWSDDGELVIVRRRHIGTMVRTLEIPQVRFVPKVR